MESYPTLHTTESQLSADLSAKKNLVRQLIQEALKSIRVDRQQLENDVCRIYIQILNDRLIQVKVNLVQKYRESLKHILRTEGEALAKEGYQVIQHSTDSFYFLLHYQNPQY